MYYIIYTIVVQNNATYDCLDKLSLSHNVTEAMRFRLMDVDEFNRSQRHPKTLVNCGSSFHSTTIPSSKHTKNYGKSPFSMGKSTN